MGYDVARFLGDVENDVICPICREVLKEPLQVPKCEHAFCKDCIQEWLTRQTWCPIDRGELFADRLKPVPRILRNLLSKLDISCDNAKYGCQEFIKLDRLQIHLPECEFDPKRPVPCIHGCGIVIPRDKLGDHNCIHEMRLLLQQQNTLIQQILSAEDRQCRQETVKLDHLDIHMSKRESYPNNPVPSVQAHSTVNPKRIVTSIQAHSTVKLKQTVPSAQGRSMVNPKRTVPYAQGYSNAMLPRSMTIPEDRITVPISMGNKDTTVTTGGIAQWNRTEYLQSITEGHAQQMQDARQSNWKCCLFTMVMVFVMLLIAAIVIVFQYPQ